MADLELPPKVSSSQLVSYALCARKYAAQYVLGLEPEFRSTALVEGSVVHSAIGWWFGERLQGRSPNLDEVREVVAADFLAETAEERIHWREATPESVEARAADLVCTYLTEYGDLPVAAVEQPFELPLRHPRAPRWTLRRRFLGFLDLVLEDGTVVELKTSAKAWPESFLARHLQVGGYAYAWNTLHGGPSKVEVHVVIKTKKPRVDTYRIERGGAETVWWFEATAEIERAIGAGVFPPSPGPLCVACEFQGACRRWDEVTADARSVRRLPVHREVQLAYAM